MIKTIKLGDITKIQTGYSFRGAVKDEGTGVAVVQARDIDGLYVASERLPRVRQAFPGSRALTKGDVLLTSRGAFRAGVVNQSTPTVASSSLFILHMKNGSFLPEFLALCLNSTYAQSYLRQQAKGATIQSVTVSDLAELNVPTLPIDRQRLLVNLQQNVEIEGNLLRTKLDTIYTIYTHAIDRSLKGAA